MPPAWTARRGPWLTEILLAAAAVAALGVLAPLNTDSGWYLIGARRWLDGERLYVDLIDVNPPLIFWLMALPATVGARLGLDDARVMGAFSALVLAASIVTAVRVFRFGEPQPRSLGGLLVGAFLVSMTLLSAIQVGQREQLVGLLFLPYVCLAARTAQRQESTRTLRLVCGLMAGVGIALKPFFMAPWIAVELAVLTRLRGSRAILRPESLSIAALQVAYLLLIAFATPEYIFDIVPLARATYQEYGRPWTELLPLTRTYVTALAGASGLIAGWFLSGPSAAYASVSGAATLGFLAAYVLQSKGFGYHLLPAQVFGAVALMSVLYAIGSALRSSRATGSPLFLTAAGVVVLAAATAATAFGPVLVADFAEVLREPYDPALLKLVEVVEARAVGEPVYMISTSTWPSFPLVNLARARWPYHYNCLWPLPALYPEAPVHYRLPAAQSDLERRLFETVVQDLIRTPPRLLIIDRRSDVQAMRGRRFDFVRYFSNSPEFARLFQRYRRLGYVAEWEIFERQNGR